MENDLPPEHPASSGGKERAPSPWELDHDWQEAPKDLKKLRPAPPPPPTPARELKRPVPVAAPPPRKEPEEAPEPREMYVPMVRRRQPAPETQGSWPAMILLSMGLLLFVFVAWQYLHDEPRGADAGDPHAAEV
jgi:hypothetical protein